MQESLGGWHALGKLSVGVYRRKRQEAFGLIIMTFGGFMVWVEAVGILFLGCWEAVLDVREVLKSSSQVFGW